MVRKYLYLIILVIVVDVSIASRTITQFDDSSIPFNSTSDITKLVRFNGNDTIYSANLTLKGLKYFWLNNGYALDPSGAYEQYLDLIPNNNEFFSTTDSLDDSIIRLNSSGGELEVETFDANDGINFIMPTTAEYQFRDITAISNGSLWVLDRSVTDTFNYIAKINWTKKINNTNSIYDYINLSFIANARGLYVNDAQTMAWVTTDAESRIYIINITNCQDHNCRNSYNFTQTNHTLPATLISIDSDDNGTTFYGVSDTTPDIYIINGTDYSTISVLDVYNTIDSVVDASKLNDLQSVTVNNTQLFAIDYQSTYELVEFYYAYPSSMQVSSGESVVFSSANPFDNTTTIDLSSSDIISWLLTNSTLPIKFDTTGGRFEVSALSIYANVNGTAQSARISPLTVYTDTGFSGFCNVTDYDNDTIKYYWQWLNDSVLYSSGNDSGGNTQGIEKNLSSIASSATTNGETWTFRCRSYDGLRYSNWISTTVDIKYYVRVTNFVLAQTSLSDLTEDGTNYGQTSEGWDAGENKTKTLNAVDYTENQVFVVRSSRRNGNLNLYMNDFYIGNIPAYAGGNGSYAYHIFDINTTVLSTDPQEIQLKASASNPETVYVDYITFIGNDNITIEAGNNYVALLSNITNETGVLDKKKANVFNQSGSIVFNSLDIGSWYSDLFSVTDLYIYKLPELNQNYSFNFFANSSSIEQTGINFTLEIDSTDPVLNSITTELNVLTGETYQIFANVTEINLDVSSSNVTVNNTKYTLELNSSDGLTNVISSQSLLSHTSYGTYSAAIYILDQADNAESFSWQVKVSNATTTYPGIYLNDSYSRADNYYNLTDTETYYDLNFISNLSINGIGDAYINDYNVSFNIPDSKASSIYLILANNSITSFSQQNLTWITDVWNNSITGNTTFYNAVNYKIGNALILEYENTGTGNLRLYHFKRNNMTTNANINNIWYHLPLRSQYSSDNYSIVVQKCISSINWAAKTCGEWSTITSSVYGEYNDSYNGGVYPTIDYNGDSLKDYAYIRLPSLVSEEMFSIDLTATGETAWGGSGEGSGQSSGTGGSSGSTSENEITGETVDIPATTAKSNLFADFLKSIKNNLISITNTFSNQLSAVDFSDPTTILILISIVVIISGSFIVGSGNNNNPKIRKSGS